MALPFGTEKHLVPLFEKVESNQTIPLFEKVEQTIPLFEKVEQK